MLININVYNYYNIGQLPNVGGQWINLTCVSLYRISCGNVIGGLPELS